MIDAREIDMSVRGSRRGQSFSHLGATVIQLRADYQRQGNNAQRERESMKHFHTISFVPSVTILLNWKFPA
jgi:hypothetical protein